jgi:hypothetical protein
VHTRWTDLWGADPRVGAGRDQSTSKGLAYRGRALMLHGGGGGQFSWPLTVGAPIKRIINI